MKTEKLQGRVRGKKPRELLVKSNFRWCIYFGADYAPRFALHTRGLLSAICFSFRHEMMHFCLRHRAICLTFDATSCCFKRNMFAWSFFPQSKHQRGGGGGSNAAAKTRRELIHEPKMGNTTMPEFRLCTRNDFPTDFFTENEPRIRGRQPRRSFPLFRLFSFHFCRRDNKVRPTRKAFLLFCVCCWNAVRSLASHDWLVRSVKIEKETSFSFQDGRKRLFLSGWKWVYVRFPGLQQCYFLHRKWYQVTREC